MNLALAGWLSWLEYHPVHQKVTSSIPVQTHREAINQCFSLTSCFFHPSSLSKINKNIPSGENLKINKMKLSTSDY